LDEQQWRLLLDCKAEAVGWGGIEVVAASGASRTTVSTG
jgi:hypothetical protein